MYLRYPQRNESRGVKSGDCGGPWNEATATDPPSCKMLMRGFRDWCPVIRKCPVLLEIVSNRYMWQQETWILVASAAWMALLRKTQLPATDHTRLCYHLKEKLGWVHLCFTANWLHITQKGVRLLRIFIDYFHFGHGIYYRSHVFLYKFHETVT